MGIRIGGLGGQARERVYWVACLPCGINPAAPEKSMCSRVWIPHSPVAKTEDFRYKI